MQLIAWEAVVHQVTAVYNRFCTDAVSARGFAYHRHIHVYTKDALSAKFGGAFHLFTEILRMRP